MSTFLSLLAIIVLTPLIAGLLAASIIRAAQIPTWSRRRKLRPGSAPILRRGWFGVLFDHFIGNRIRAICCLLVREIALLRAGIIMNPISSAVLIASLICVLVWLATNGNGLLASFGALALLGAVVVRSMVVLEEQVESCEKQAVVFRETQAKAGAKILNVALGAVGCVLMPIKIVGEILCYAVLQIDVWQARTGRKR